MHSVTSNAVAEMFSNKVYSQGWKQDFITTTIGWVNLINIGVITKGKYCIMSFCDGAIGNVEIHDSQNAYYSVSSATTFRIVDIQSDTGSCNIAVYETINNLLSCFSYPLMR